MVSEFRKKKLLRIYKKFFDVDGSGAVDRKDIEDTIELMSKAHGWSAGDPKRKHFGESLRSMWADLEKQGDTDGDGKLSADEWIAVWDKYSKNPADAAEWQKIFCNLMFWIQDSAGNGEISEESYASLFAVYGIDKQKSIDAFSKISKGQKGVKLEDYQKLYHEYFSSEDPEAPGNFIFGPLVNLG